MPGIDNIIKKITDEAKERAKNIENQAVKKKEAIIGEKTEEALEIKKRILTKSDEESKSIIEKANSTANLKARDIILLAREEIIERVLNLVKDELNDLTSEDFIKYLKASTKNLNLTSKDEVKIPKKYYEDIKEADLDLNISSEFIESGFLVKKGNLIYNGDFSSIVDSMREDLMPLISDELFKK